MPRKPRVKLLEAELAYIRLARKKQEIEIPPESSFQTAAIDCAKRLLKKAGLDVRKPAHLLFMCGIINDHLFLRRAPGRPRSLTDRDAFDLLESFAFYREKRSNNRPRTISRVTNGLFYFSDRSFDYQRIFKSPMNLRKAFARNWHRLERNEIGELSWPRQRKGKRNGLDWKRSARRTELLELLRTRFGGPPSSNGGSVR